MSMDLLEHLSVIRNLRIDRNKKYDLSELFVVAVWSWKEYIKNQRPPEPDDDFTIV